MPLNLIFVSPGTYTIEDDGIPGNGTSVIKDGNGTVIFTFVHPADSLGFTVSTAGVNLIVNFTDSLGAADFSIGTLGNAAQSPDSIVIQAIDTTGDVVLVSNGAITEGSDTDSAVDIVASTLVLSAATGVGTGGDAMETQVAQLEAETLTGGINISNLGALTIGGLTDEVVGLDVETSGNLLLTNLGSIVLSEQSPGGLESVHGGATSGNVSLIANGYNSDILSTVNRDAIAAPGGNIFLQSGRDISMGTGGLDFDNDVRARGSLTIQAGRDLNVDGFADLASDGYGAATGGSVLVTAGRDINVLNATGTDGSIGAEGSASGDVSLTTGPNGFLRLLATSTATLFSSSGDVTVNADRIVLGASSGITTNEGVTTLNPTTGGWAINLGSATDGAFALELSDAELDRIFADVLIVGSNNAGPITVSSAISVAATPEVIMRSGTNITVNANMSVTTALSLRALDYVFHLAGTITTGTFTVFTDAVNDDPGVGGTALFNGIVNASVETLVEGNGDADILKGIEAVDQIFHGLGGNDIITSSGEGQYFGDDGNDTIFAGLSSGLVPEVLNGGTGIDTLDTTSFSGTYIVNLATGATNFAFESFTNFENLIAGNGNDSLTGSIANNTINGGGGNDVIDGGSGNDTMIGGLGDDTFYADVFSDVVIEAVGEGNDRVAAINSYSLAAGSSIETLESTNLSSTTAQNLTGNEFGQTITGNNGVNILEGMGGNDILQGNGGNDVLSGGPGDDIMDGGAGNDVYFVDSVLDQVNEAGGLGNDRVAASVSFTLNGGSSIETLETVSLSGTDPINLTGNALTQTIIGNNGSNILTSGGGTDTLIGAGGNDFLVGNASIGSIMQGGTGNDTYYVSIAGDVVTEGVGAGTDRIATSVGYALAAGSEVEQLEVGDSASVTNLSLTGNEFANSITGNAGNNLINGKLGNDVLTGLAGFDTFAFDTTLGASNIDQIVGFVSGGDRIQIENAVFFNIGAGSLPAASFKIGAAATDADDRIIYNSATGALFYDSDGNGAAAQVQFATLVGAPALAASDFLVV